MGIYLFINASWWCEALLGQIISFRSEENFNFINPPPFVYRKMCDSLDRLVARSFSIDTSSIFRSFD